MEIMTKGTKDVCWTEIENSLISQWYFVSKVMGEIIPYTFPYLTFQGIVDEIEKDPNYKKPDEEKE